MTAIENRKRFRLLVIEDDPSRLDRFYSWVPSDTHIVWARSAGVALGVIRRDSGYVYGGVLLDHDLNEQAKTVEDLGLSGTQVTEALIQNFSFEIPVLVHSANAIKAPIMVRRLEEAGFWVTRIPMQKLTPQDFDEWITEAKEIWKDKWN